MPPDYQVYLKDSANKDADTFQTLSRVRPPRTVWRRYSSCYLVLFSICRVTLASRQVFIVYMLCVV